MSQLIHAVSVLLIACTTGVIGTGRSGGISSPRDARDMRGEGKEVVIVIVFLFKKYQQFYSRP